MSNNDKKEEKDLLSYRVDKLEEAVDALKEIVMKINTYIERTDAINKRVDAVETAVAEIKTWMYKVAGALVVIGIIVQLLGPVIMSKVFPDKPTPQKIESVK